VAPQACGWVGRVGVQGGGQAGSAGALAQWVSTCLHASALTGASRHLKGLVAHSKTHSFVSTHRNCSRWVFDTASATAPVIDATASVAVGNSISFDRLRSRQVRVPQLPCMALTNDRLEVCSSRSIRPLGRAAARAKAAASSSPSIVESARGRLSSTCLSVRSSTACLDIQCWMVLGKPLADSLSSIAPAQLSCTTTAAALLVQRSRLMVDNGNSQRLNTRGKTASPASEESIGGWLRAQPRRVFDQCVILWNWCQLKSNPVPMNELVGRHLVKKT